ncbi:MAG TPA: hypothetical protein VFX39_04235 [Gemmatimonadaceae bacterium]|nr:hypothetical protein [Gemmatimonadaceae bacterium]
MSGVSGAAHSSTAAALPVRRAPIAMSAVWRRPTWRPVAGDSVGGIAGFTRIGDTLVVLEPHAHRVLLLRVDGAEWRAVGGWGRRGGGPGEFQRPVAIAALAGDTIAVAEEGGRVQLFTLDGRYHRAERSAFPCMMLQAAVAYEEDGTRWLAGLCIGSRAAADTIFTALFRASRDGDYAEVLRVPRMTLDLSWGELLATPHPLSDAGDAGDAGERTGGAVWLGIGLDDCVYEMTGGTTTPHRRCNLVRERLSSPPPEGLEEDRRRARQRGDQKMLRALRWPESLPPYFGIVRDAAGGTVLARPVSGDSLVLVPAGEPFDTDHVRLVAPIRPFLQCVRGACLWFDAERGSIALHDATGADAAPSRAP